MKKIKNLKRILIIILFIICMGISSFATSYLLNATQVSYGSGSVKTALDDLYYKSKDAETFSGFGPVNSEYVSSFGKIVSDYSPTGGGTWRLFYADSEYAYLLRNSIGNYALNNTDVVTGFDTSTISTLGKKMNGKFNAKSSTMWTDKANNNNVKAVAALLDTSKWTSYKSNDAVWAIGAPTLEMFVASYNATHSSIKLDCVVRNASYTGYDVGKSTDGSEVICSMAYVDGLGSGATDLDGAIYCPSSGCWWLASPASGGVGWMFNVGSSWRWICGR